MPQASSETPGPEEASWDPSAEEEGTLRHLHRQFLNRGSMEEIPQNLWSESFKKKHKT